MDKAKKETLAILGMSVGVATILELCIWKMSWSIFHSPRPQPGDEYSIPIILLITFGGYLSLLKVLMRVYRNESH
jgi:hypothetical protein